MFVTGLLRWNKVYKHGWDELHWPPVVALNAPRPLWKYGSHLFLKERASRWQYFTCLDIDLLLDKLQPVALKKKNIVILVSLSFWYLSFSSTGRKVNSHHSHPVITEVIIRAGYKQEDTQWFHELPCGVISKWDLIDSWQHINYTSPGVIAAGICWESKCYWSLIPTRKISVVEMIGNLKKIPSSKSAIMETSKGSYCSICVTVLCCKSVTCLMPMCTFFLTHNLIISNFAGFPNDGYPLIKNSGHKWI